MTDNCVKRMTFAQLFFSIPEKQLSGVFGKSCEEKKSKQHRFINDDGFVASWVEVDAEEAYRKAKSRTFGIRFMLDFQLQMKY